MRKLTFLFPGLWFSVSRDGLATRASISLLRGRESCGSGNAHEARDLSSLPPVFANGQSGELQMTVYTQPAMLACSVAAYRVLEQADFTPRLCQVGKSLGE